MPEQNYIRISGFAVVDGESTILAKCFLRVDDPEWESFSEQMTTPSEIDTQVNLTHDLGKDVMGDDVCQMWARSVDEEVYATMVHGLIRDRTAGRFTGKAILEFIAACGDRLGSNEFDGGPDPIFVIAAVEVDRADYQGVGQ